MIVTELDGLDSSYKLATRVDVLVDGVVERTIDETVEGQVSFDGNAASRGRVDLTIVDDGRGDLIPTQAGDLLSPYGNEVAVYRGRYVGSEPHLYPLGIYRIDRSTADGEQVRISGTDRSARIIDAAFEDPYNVTSGTNVTTAISNVITPAYPDVTTDFVSVTVPLPALIADEGDDRWAFAQGLAKAIGCELFFDDAGTLVLRPIVTSISGNPDAEFNEGDVLLGAERDWDRSPVYNRVIATGENTTETTIPRGVATDENALSPTYYHGDFGHKPYRWSNPYITSSTQASTAAASILAQKLGAPDIISFEALVDPARRPGDVVRVTRERLGALEDHCLDRVDIPLGHNGTMSGNTRATQEIES